MDAAQQPQPPGVNKGSAIPRLSKLPLPRTKVVQPTTQPEVSTLSRPLLPTPRLQKRASVASFSTSTSSVSREAIGPPTRPHLQTGSKHGVRAAHPARATSISSRANLQRPPASLVKASANANDEENHDQLASLDSFRSAPQEHVEKSREPTAPRSRKVSRLSLSDRTVESLNTIPSTPKDRRRSSFFNPLVSPMGQPPRPASSLATNGARPGTSDGTFAKPTSRPASPNKRLTASAAPSSRTTHASFGFGRSAGGSRRVSTNLTNKLQDARSKADGASKPAPAKSIEASPAKAPTLAKGSGIRTTKRPPLGDAFAPAKKGIPDGTAIQIDNGPKRVLSSSSAALRQQIAAAKAAARKDRPMLESPQDSVTSSSTYGIPDFGIHADPFNQAPKDEKHILKNRVNAARMDGRLNISAMGLKAIPEEVRTMYDPSPMEESKVTWSEVVDLSKFIAADNELEGLDELLFPDRSADDFAMDEFSEGNQFGGLESLDLHGNHLQTLPIGLRRLQRLTVLDLAHNKLDNSALDVIGQIESLKELKLGHNALTGSLPTSICGLAHLQVLDLPANRLLGLPESLRELVSLKVLNVSGNQLTALPMDALQQLSLTELDASGNALIASLFPPGGVDGHATLQTLSVANNSLAALTFSGNLDFPRLRTLDVTNNHMTILPRVSNWTELVTLAVGDNKLTDFPAGFTALHKLRHANFASNDIRLLDPEICRMSSLESLVLAANPLREKKFLTMSAADIKRDLKARLTPIDRDEGSTDGDPGSPVTVIGAQDAAASIWMLKGSGLLDLSGKSLSDDINDHLGSFLKDSEVKDLQLQANRLTCVPPALWLAQDLRILDLSDNALTSDYLSAELELPSLRELNLSRCRLTSLEPLTSQLVAPQLQILNISANRLSGALPTLRAIYPGLSTLLASDNRFDSISATALRGLHAVNLKSNNLQQLPAEIGLLWELGLRDLDVGSNAFRVPNYRILDKGTEAVLRWLRDRLPADQKAPEHDDVD